MLNAFKFEMKKIFWSKMIYICSGIICGIKILEWFVLNHIAPVEMANELMKNNGYLGDFINSAIIEMSRGGFYIVCMIAVAVTLVTEEYSKGIFKGTIVMQKRINIAVGKLLAAFSVSTIWVLVTWIITAIMGVALYGIPIGNMGSTLIVVLGSILISFSFAAVYMFIFSFMEKPTAAIGLGFMIYIALSIGTQLIGADYHMFILGGLTSTLNELTASTVAAVYLNAIVYGMVASILFCLSINKKEILL